MHNFCFPVFHKLRDEKDQRVRWSKKVLTFDIFDVGSKGLLPFSLDANGLETSNDRRRGTLIGRDESRGVQAGQRNCRGGIAEWRIRAMAAYNVDSISNEPEASQFNVGALLTLTCRTPPSMPRRQSPCPDSTSLQS